MSIIGCSALHLVDPPSAAVFELAERAVEYVRRALGVTLDYTPETLPLLDHWLGQVPRDQPETIVLSAAVAGAYFGEIARRALGGGWDDTDGEPSTWRMTLGGGVSICPAGLATLAVLQAEDESVDGGFDVPPAALPAVEAALDAVGEVPVDEFFSLTGRLEALMLVVDTAVAAQTSGGGSSPASDDDEPGN
jgi:hypothetical protein